MKNKEYLSLVSHYEACLEKHGDSHLGVDWPNKEDAETRYNLMLGVIRNTTEDVRLLDFGCGASHLYDHILRRNLNAIRYSGLDVSEKFIALSRRKYPSNDYYCLDILDDPSGLPEFDYIVMNGVFTEKRGLAFGAMFEFLRDCVSAAYGKARAGLAFNVMSKQVDWERPDLFYLSFDVLAEFLAKKVSRHFVIRNDYGLYEYTVYVYRNRC